MIHVLFESKQLNLCRNDEIMSDMICRWPKIHQMPLRCVHNMETIYDLWNVCIRQSGIAYCLRSHGSSKQYWFHENILNDFDQWQNKYLWFRCWFFKQSSVSNMERYTTWITRINANQCTAAGENLLLSTLCATATTTKNQLIILYHIGLRVDPWIRSSRIICR